jgi:hypothetical protein
MKKARGSDCSHKTAPGDQSDGLHHIRVSEARAQVGSQRAAGIRDEWADNTTTSDAELLLKTVEARYGRETYARLRADLGELDALRRQTLQELLRKAELDTPVRPPKHARFAVFLLPRAYQHIIFGDLEEQYPKWAEECGRSKATFLYWWQLVLSATVIMWPRIRIWRYLAVVLWLALHILRTWH